MHYRQCQNCHHIETGADIEIDANWLCETCESYVLEYVRFASKISATLAANAGMHAILMPTATHNDCIVGRIYMQRDTIYLLTPVDTELAYRLTDGKILSVHIVGHEIRIYTKPQKETQCQHQMKS